MNQERAPTTRLLAGSLLCMTVALSGCARNPATGETDFVLMSEEREIEVGREMHEKVVSGVPVYGDEELNAYVNRVGRKIAAQADRPELDYRFTIVDNPDINAFALPGGFVYVNRGLLGYLQSEAQLAAVLAHEIGHITARHGVRRDSVQKSAGVGTGILSVLSVLTTGTNVVGDVAGLYASAAVMGYGREMELEADQFGAQYLYQSGYDPQAMVEVISILKDHERFSRSKARDQGESPQTYHGVFATHPRNDQRLREVVGAAGDLDYSPGALADAADFRRRTEGLVFGENFAAAEAAEEDPRQFVHERFGFAIRMPEDWQADNRGSAVEVAPADESATLRLEVDNLRDNIGPSEYIRQEMGVPLLRDSQPLNQFGLIGHTGLAPGEDEDATTRVAVLYQGNRVYRFRGSVANGEQDQYDSMFMETIRSFQPVQTRRGGQQPTRRIHYVRANERTTFAALAQLEPFSPHAEEQLRLLNNYYPNGEPEPGEWIKIVK